MADVVKKEYQYTCRFCGYGWNARTERVPRECPSCKRYKWQEIKPIKGEIVK